MHSPTGDSRGRGSSGHGEKPAKQGALTPWRQRREGLVRTRKEPDRPRHTHILETAEGGPCQDRERNRPVEAHSQTGNGRGRVLVRTRKETDQPRRTHQLETAEGLGQDTERNRPTEAHSHPGDSRGRGLSGYRRKSTERQAWALTY